MNIEQQLRRDEGEILHAYQDHLGYWTIGVGTLIDKRKGGALRPEESAFILNNRIGLIQNDLNEKLPWFASLNDARRGALINMAFQLGVKGLMGFKNTLTLIGKGEYEKASREMLGSKWANQTPARAMRVSKQMRTGEWQ